MGWSGGTDVMNGIIRAAKEHVPADSRQEFYQEVIEVLEDADWDCQEECRGKDGLFDAALAELHPEWDEDR